MKQASSSDRQFFCFVRGSDMVATGQEIVWEFHFKSGKSKILRVYIYSVP